MEGLGIAGIVRARRVPTRPCAVISRSCAKADPEAADNRFMDPQAPIDVVTDVFLSPRVVDRAALSEYASTLRGLITEAGAEAQRLHDAASTAASARESLRTAVGKTGDQARLAGELIKSLALRASSIEPALERARSFGDRLDDLLRRSESAAAALESRIADAQAKSEQFGAERLEAVLARAGETADRLAAIGETAAAATERLQRSLDGAIEFTDRLLQQHESLLKQSREGVEASREAGSLRDGIRRDLEQVSVAIARIARVAQNPG